MADVTSFSRSEQGRRRAHGDDNAIEQGRSLLRGATPSGFARRLSEQLLEELDAVLVATFLDGSTDRIENEPIPLRRQNATDVSKIIFPSREHLQGNQVLGPGDSDRSTANRVEPA